MTYSPCILIHNPLAFQLAFRGNIKHDAIITKIELSCVSFCATFTDFLSCWFIDFHGQNDGSKLNSVFKILRFHESVAVMVRSYVL